MSKIRGIVTKTDGKSCILLTPQGEFVRARVKPAPKVGQEVMGSPITRSWYTPAAVVAALLIISLIIPFYPLLTANAQPVAYVSLDINPSVELGVNKEGTVVKAQAFNPEGDELLQRAAVDKQNVYMAVETLVEQAVQGKFVSPDKANLIVAVYTGDANFSFDQGRLEDMVKEKIAEANLSADVLVSSASMAEHKAASANHTSLGKYVVYQAAKTKGKDLDLEDLKQHGINHSLKAKGVEMKELEPELKKVGPGKKPQGQPDKGTDGQTRPLQPKPGSPEKPKSKDIPSSGGVESAYQTDRESDYQSGHESDYESDYEPDNEQGHEADRSRQGDHRD